MFNQEEKVPVDSIDRKVRIPELMTLSTHASDIRLVAADMDGTLLNSRHELNSDFFPIYQQMKAKGILFAAASGRQFYNLLNRFSSVQEEIIFVAENGSYVVYQGQDILVEAMDANITRAQLQLARQIPDTDVVLCGKKQAYVESDNEPFIRQVKMYYDRFEKVDDLLQVEGDQFLKIAIYDFAGAEGNSYPHFQNSKSQLQVKVSGKSWLDLSHPLANKGRAIQVLQSKFGITPAQTMAFGDYLNDLEMMQQAYFSYAMANAHPDIKNVSRFGAKSNDEDGVLEVLRQLV